MRKRLTTSNCVWLAIYLATIVGVVVLVLRVREQTLPGLQSVAAQAEWDTWRAAAREQAESGPVRRVVPKSAEPPGLVLLRDRFAVVMSAAIVFGSLLFAALMCLLRGSLARTSPPGNTPSPEKQPPEPQRHARPGHPAE